MTANNVHQAARITSFVARRGGWVMVTAMRMVSGNRVTLLRARDTKVDEVVTDQGQA